VRFLPLSLRWPLRKTKSSMSGKCGKLDVQQNIPAGDPVTSRTMFLLSGQGKCATKGEEGGTASKEGRFSEHGDVAGNHSKAWGVYVETFDSGDKIFYTYQAAATMKDGALQTGQNQYQITGGTGKMKGIKGSGTCKTTGTPMAAWTIHALVSRHPSEPLPRVVRREREQIAKGSRQGGPSLHLFIENSLSGPDHDLIGRRDVGPERHWESGGSSSVRFVCVLSVSGWVRR